MTVITSRATSRRERTEHLAATYLTVQAVATVAWWIGLAASPGFRALFDPVPQTRAVLDVYLLADLCMLAIGSAVVAWGVRSGRSWAALLTAGVAGGLAYATLTLVGWLTRGGGGIVGAGVMVAATLVTATIAATLQQGAVA
jgi:hypothetical protein